MTTYFAFVPSLSAAPRFQPTLDGEQYVCSCFWNLFAQRYYLNCVDSNGDLIFSLPLVETPAAIALNSVTWSELTGHVTATTQTPHGYPLGAAVELTIAGCSPVGYNGAQLVMITGPSAFTYPLDADPGAAIVSGSATQMVNLAGGYFLTSTIIYRNQTFEVSP